MKVNLWFAYDNEMEDVISITDSCKGNKYTCPICNSEVIPKALESKTVSPHFAHVDRNKCDNEAMIHWWYKNKFIERRDTFTIKTDTEYTYVCADFTVEKQYSLSTGVYRPDLVIITECGKEVIFEMANTNKKKVQDYIDRWMELDKVIVEVDIKMLQSKDKVFNALYYNGKCFNFNKRDGGYYNAIGKLKEKMKQDGKYDIELVRKLDWFWKDVIKYESGKSDIEVYSNIIDELLSTSYKTEEIVKRILRKSSCSNLYRDYKEFKMLDDLVVYPYIASPDYLINLIQEINSKFKKLDSRFEIKLKYIVDPVYETYYNGSRKYMYKSRLVDKNYNFEINMYNKKKKVANIPVTNRFDLVDDKDTFIKSIVISSLSKFKHKCMNCKSQYTIDEGELKFIISKDFELPKRCKSCRQKRKKERF